MEYPLLKALRRYRQTVSAFRGYNRNDRIGDGEFAHMENMTSDCYPLLSPRKRRGSYAAVAASGLIAKDSLCHVEGSRFVMNGYGVDMGLSQGEKQLVGMGAYVIILPDKKYINTRDLTDWGDLDARFTTEGKVKLTLCNAEGEVYSLQHAPGAGEPASPQNLDLWIDTAQSPHVLKQWSEATGLWVRVDSTYVRIENPGLGKAFSQYDGITLSGLGATEAAALEGSAVVWQKGEDYIVVAGLLDKRLELDTPVTAERAMPEMDFVVESENRLWGCRYGLDAQGRVVNELYASKLGDFKNWRCYMGLSTDSYAASLGSDGPFTGAVTHLGYPIFFKEHCMHKVYGNLPENFQVQTTACRGVQPGCHRSLAVVGETLFYKATGGILAYDGSLPREVSQALAGEKYERAAAGAVDNKYYVSMADGQGQWQLLVYDTARGLWHREDGLHVTAFCCCRGELYAATEDGILALLGSGEAAEARVRWLAETGPWLMELPERKYVACLDVGLSMEADARVRILVAYDLDGQWEPVWTLESRHLRNLSVPIRPRRCDHFRLRLEGEGVVKLYGITRILEKGSDLR